MDIFASNCASMFPGGLSEIKPSLFWTSIFVSPARRERGNTTNSERAKKFRHRLADRGKGSRPSLFIGRRSGVHHRACVSSQPCNWCNRVGTSDNEQRPRAARRHAKHRMRFYTPNVPKANSDASWEMCKARRVGRAGERKKKGRNTTEYEERKRNKREQSETRSSKFALNSQIIENAVPVSAHNAYRSRARLSVWL